ncbi:hypothetical protein OFB72_29520, partial [Escherichia coli]|nr:hypothetical protein [Escherichia coli]
NKSGLVKKPHQLTGICGRNALAFSYLGQSQTFAFLQCRKLDKTSEPIFLLCGYLHILKRLWLITKAKQNYLKSLLFGQD